MFVTELFEAKIHKTVVIMPGGFHPFHPGHGSLYNAAVDAFPNADVYVAATNDTSERPFPYAVKQKLAEFAGVPAGRFVQVKSPFQAKEITSHYDPATTALIFVRSDKDRDQQPQAGTVKKDGTPSYFQPMSKNLAPMSQHGYMAYLPTVEFGVGGAGATSATEIRKMWPGSSLEQKQQIARDLYPRVANNPKAIEQIVKLLSGPLGEATMAMPKVDLDTNYIKLIAHRYRQNPGMVSAKEKEILAKYLQDLKDKKTVKEANPNQQSALYNPQGATYRGEKMPGYDPEDFYSEKNPRKRIDTVQHQDLANRFINEPNELEKAERNIDIARLKDRIKASMKTLSPAATAILNMRYWKGLTYQETAAAMKLSIERVRQIEAKALRQLRHSSRGAELAPFAEDAAGVIAKKGQENDPRYSMSLTKDVRPGQIEKNLRALHLEAREPYQQAIDRLEVAEIEKLRDKIADLQSRLKDPNVDGYYRQLIAHKIEALQKEVEKEYQVK